MIHSIPNRTTKKSFHATSYISGNGVSRETVTNILATAVVAGSLGYAAGVIIPPAEIISHLERWAFDGTYVHPHVESSIPTVSESVDAAQHNSVEEALQPNRSVPLPNSDSDSDAVSVPHLPLPQPAPDSGSDSTYSIRSVDSSQRNPERNPDDRGSIASGSVESDASNPESISGHNDPADVPQNTTGSITDSDSDSDSDSDPDPDLEFPSRCVFQ